MSLINQERLPEAEAPFKRALTIYTAALGADHPLTIVALKNLGKLYLDLGRAADAKRLIDQSPPSVRSSLT